MIELHDVTIRSGSFVLSHLSLTVPAGSYAVLMGKTGSGKTTLLEALCGLRPVQSGKIRMQDRDVTHARPAERQIGYVPQDLALFPTMTVREQLEFALKIRRMDGSSRRKRVRELAELLQLGELLNRRPAELSGGESQRAALGRALSFQPAILLLDEPLSALDEETRLQMQQLLKSVHRSTPMTVLHVTHSQAEAVHLGNQILKLTSGTIIPSAPKPEQQTPSHETS